MGAWGPAIFSDDLAEDIRTEYRELLEDRVPDEEATRRVVERYGDLDEDEAHVLWLALAATQSRLGRLEEQVRDRALAVIEDGAGLEPWRAEGAALLAERQKALAELRERLTGPQPDRKAVRRPWRYETDLVAGTVLSYGSDERRLLRVVRLHEDRYVRAPLMELLNWRGTVVPGVEEIAALRVATTSGAGGPTPRLYQPVKGRKKDQDWPDAGFVAVADGVTRPGDDTSYRPRPVADGGPGQIPAPINYLRWVLLAEHLDRLVEGRTTF